MRAGLRILVADALATLTLGLAALAAAPALGADSAALRAIGYLANEPSPASLPPPPPPLRAGPPRAVPPARRGPDAPRRRADRGGDAARDRRRPAGHHTRAHRDDLHRRSREPRLCGRPRGAPPRRER